MTDTAASPVLLRREGAVAHLRFNRPQALNAIDLPLAQAFHAACRALAADQEVRVVVMSGEGRAFMAGGDLPSMVADPLHVPAAEGTKFTMAYPRIGTSADCSTSWNLVRLLGPRKAMEIALLSDPIDAAEALRLGLINRVVPADALEGEASRLAARIASGAPLALGNLKRLVREAGDNDLSTHLALEAKLFQQCAASADFTEGIGAFLGKREAKFSGR